MALVGRDARSALAESILDGTRQGNPVIDPHDMQFGIVPERPAEAPDVAAEASPARVEPSPTPMLRGTAAELRARRPQRQPHITALADFPPSLQNIELLS